MTWDRPPVVHLSVLLLKSQLRQGLTVDAEPYGVDSAARFAAELGMTAAELKESAKALLSMTDEKIGALVDEFGPEGATGTDKAALKKLLVSFGDKGISAEELQAFLGHKIGESTPRSA